MIAKPGEPLWTACLDLHRARRLQKPLRPSADSWLPSTQGRLTPMTPRREHSDGSWREPRQRGRRRRGAGGVSDDPCDPVPYRILGDTRWMDLQTH